MATVSGLVEILDSCSAGVTSHVYCGVILCRQGRSNRVMINKIHKIALLL